MDGLQRRECRRKKNAPSFATFCHIIRRNPRDVSPRRWRLFLFFLSLPSVFSVPGAVQCHRSRGLRPTAFSGTIFKYDVASFVFDVKPNASPKLPLLKNIEGVVPEALLGVRLRDRGVKPDALFGDFLAEEVAFDLGAGLVFGNLSIFQLLRKSGRTWKAKAAHLLCTWRL